MIEHKQQYMLLSTISKLKGEVAVLNNVLTLVQFT